MILATALAAHQAGRLDEAEALYRALLEAGPEHADALHLLGVVRHQRGEDRAAVDLIERAIALRDDNYKYHYNLAAALQALGRFGEALERTRRAAALAPDVAAVRLALAHLLHTLGQPAAAEPEFRAALALSPGDAEALAGLAASLHSLGRLGEAEEGYRAALDARPDNAPALVNLGAVLHAQGRLDNAAACHRRAIAIEPALTPAHVNLGAVLQAQGRMTEAVKSYRQALTLSPADATAHFNLGTAVQAVGWLEEALRCYRDALRLWPGYAEAHNNLAQVLEDQGHLTDAVAAFRRACALRPDRPEFQHNLAACLYMLYRRDPEAARAEAARWLAEHPDQPVARHRVRAFAENETPPARPAEDYVRTLFDGFAPSFDHDLLSIGYCGPELMAAAFAKVVPVPRGDLDVLDAGCGTGLCAPVLRPWARTLTGVDVSPRMLERARRRGLYDTLATADLTAWLDGRSAAFDLIAADDVLCYLGDLEPAIPALARALRPGGALAFTLEQAPDAAESYRLAPHGRYLHGETATRALLARHGLTVACLHVANLRDEDGQPSPNLVVLATKP